ncbi:MAG: hypothetical protein ABSF23_03370 [Terracidiphilus sp.]|jgi:hypothetical protein
MADTLYLSLWYPNLRLEALPEKLRAVLRAFAAHGGEATVYSATVWPVSWNETPVFERVYGRIAAGQENGQLPGADPRVAVEEATELLHDDFAYEFQIGWGLWELEAGPEARPSPRNATADPSTAFGARSAPNSAQDDNSGSDAQDDRPGTGAQDDRSRGLSELAQDESSGIGAQGGGNVVRMDARWARGPRLVRVTGYGPLFDEGAYEQDGHIRIDFGDDAPFLEEEADLDRVGARHVEENVRQLVELAGAVEKASGATARLLWSELGESLAARLAQRLGMGN